MSARPTANVRPFPWEALPSFDRDQVDRANRLLRLIPRRGERSRALQEIAEQLEGLTGLEHGLEVRGARLQNDPARGPTFGDAFRTQFHLPPNPEVGAVAVDMELIDLWLDSLLDTPPETRTLGAVDDREFGLVTFVVLSVLKRLREWGAPPVVVPTDPPLDDILEDQLRDAETLVEWTIGARVLGETHLVRVFIPDGLLRKMEVSAEGFARRSESARQLRDGPLGDLRLTFPVSGGVTRLERETASELGRGDVVLFDEDGWGPNERPREGEQREGAPDHPEPGARLHLRPGARDRFLAGYLRARPTGWAFEIADRRLRIRERSMADSTTDTDDPIPPEEPDDETSSAATELLESPEVDLEVRVGSAHLTVRELGDLGAGHILELDREVEDRVDLVVEGEPVGTGELVDVEGRLGVRIEQIDN